MNQQIPFMERLKLAWRLLVDSQFAARVNAGLDALETKAAAAKVPPEKLHASGLMLVAALQREGRLVDFLQQDIAAFSDEDVGSAARVVHGGCRKVLKQFFQFEPAMNGNEGMPMTVPGGFDAQRIRLTGNVGGNPPFNGVLKHHGWVAVDVKMPAISEALDPRIVAPAEVELP
jgi:uncharacterized protein DUF2760